MLILTDCLKIKKGKAEMSTSPPVPQGLREMLKEYPEHIDRLQEALNTVIEKPSKVTPPIEVAIWVLESRLETFISEARSELRIAEEGGDPNVIEHAKKKLRLMLDCGSSGPVWSMKDLIEYFDKMRSGVRHGE